MAFIPVYILILFFTIVIDYFAGILIENTTHQKRKWWLVMSLMANVGVLAYFKYYNFFIDNINTAFNLQGDSGFSFLGIILPIGLSFHTFQAMSYTIEVYRGNQKAERHFGIYALYVMFYPQLVAGPIERPQNVIHQLKEKHSFDYGRAVSSMQIILWGLVKKILIADRLAIVVNEVYRPGTTYSGSAYLVATIFFAVQIYCDFSGYSDIAIGTARILGIDLMKNFDTPYFSKSVTEFWRRWHISLSTWFRDYVYIPLGGSKKGKFRWYFNLLFVFLISGLWHGANWTFVIWGGLLGFALVIEAITRKFRGRMAERLPAGLFNSASRLITLSFICLTWIFFRAGNVTQATDIVATIFSFSPDYFKLTNVNLGGVSYLGVPQWQLVACLLLIVSLFTIEWLYKEYGLKNWLEQKPTYIRWGAYYAMIIFLLLFGAFTTNEFIYFQF
ncbi:MBOAT family O-acyltransferase [Polluticoccus soli]|uniref:MBOAT family O-acyltransferase n=1 Tax=Polluticoccus soli TaxID=3034150 RepID=UPI0023E1BA77|nr:MBOAT family O-acyltransferase [Flavipsychrobacter sp. JY13-12]